MKAIRGKYKNAIDTGRRSGHGRVVFLYLELCEEIWGGSPSTTTLHNGLETRDMEDTAAASSACSSASVSLEESATDDESLDITPAAKQRRDQLEATLKGHRHDRLKRKLPAEAHNAAEDRNLKKKLVDIIETAENRAAENMSKMADTLDRLTATITYGFAFLRQVVQPLPPPPPPYYSFPFQGRDPFGQAYAHTPPPHPNSYGNTPTNVVPLSTVNVTDLADTHDEGRQDAISYASP
ncbi:uncharacterized protein LOC132883229 isoform X2 [Neoarius graeffei]|nr:uncharacterized protein LOC132883229 isoform X2 [Neoarius graeffei]